jgi:hypothetical protein
MTRVALQGEAEGKVILSTPGTGRKYRRGKSAVHVASVPGAPPAPDLGDLRKRLTHEVVVRGDEVIARINSNDRKSLWLELGTEHIAPRPFMRPLLRKMRDAARAILKADRL